jgi:hypothetical protein
LRIFTLDVFKFSSLHHLFPQSTFCLILVLSPMLKAFLFYLEGGETEAQGGPRPPSMSQC